MTLEVGYEIGPYQVLAHIGAGGMGEVYRARDRKLDRDVALKILPADTATIEHLRRFDQEARAASALNHPNIIAIYDIGREGTIAYIAMELVEGRDLRELIDQGPLTLKQSLRILCKIADGLSAAHARAITHRDLKPENVMISGDGFVKILDFGLAKLVRAFSQSGTTVPHTTPGVVLGTIHYMSPEQAAGRAIDFRSDQFSFGIMLYELLAGRRPFEGPSAAETMTAIIREEPVPVTTHNTNVPSGLLKILDRCLAKDPDDRYASTRDLAHDLREIRDSLTHGSGPRTGNQPRAIPRLSWPMAAGAGALLLLLGAGSYVLARRPTDNVTDNSTTSALRSIAVLPFRNISGGDGQLFADGISETISAKLAQSRGLRVAGPSDGAPIPSNADVAEIARRKGTDLLLRGTVQRVGEQVRISWSVIDVRRASNLGADSATGATAELFALQDLVAERVLQLLRLPTTGARPHDGSLDRADDQRLFLEVVGLLQRSRDERSVDSAISKLESLLVNARDAALVNGLLGRAFFYKSQLARRPALIEQAVIYAERAAELDPSLPDVHVTLGLLRNASGRHAEAAIAFQRALALRPEMAEAVLGVAETFEKVGRAADAEREYRHALKLRPDSPSISTKYGFFCYSRGRYADAVRHFTTVTELMPDSPRGYANLGAAQQALGRYDEALAAYQRSLAIEPTGASYSNVGTLQYFLGRYGDAAAALEKAVELAPSDYLTWANLGDAYRWTPGSRERSAEAYRKALEAGRESLSVNPKEPLVHAIIASCHAKRGELAQAGSAINAALKLDPTNPNVLYQAAVVAHLRGSDDTAATWLKRALDAGYSADDARRDPEITAVHAMIGSESKS